MLVIEQNAHQRCVYVPEVHWTMPTLTERIFTSGISNRSLVNTLNYLGMNILNKMSS